MNDPIHFLDRLPMEPIPRELSESKKRFLKVFRRNPDEIAYAARVAQVPRRTVYNWIKSDPLFAETYEILKAVMRDFVKSKLMKLIANDDKRAIKFYLKFKKSESDLDGF